jgi:cysteine desulfurase
MVTEVERIYLDHAATSPMHPSVIETMIKVMKEQFGNPSSIHSFGRATRHLLNQAREDIAKSIGAKSNEIIFTSGGTEADNLAIMGIAEAYHQKGKHIITTVIEHHAVLHSCRVLEKNGFEVTYLPVDETGMVSVHSVQEALREDTILVTIMYGNNEVGTVQPISEIGKMLKELNHQAFFHTDAVQAFGLEIIDVQELKVDLLSVSAHKFNGPKGIGFLYVKSGLNLAPRTFGGEQERKRRAGTENVASIIGLFEVVKIAQEQMLSKREQYKGYKAILIEYLKQENVPFFVNGSLDHSLPHVLNLSFPGVNVETLLVNLDLAGIAVSSGSACTAGSIEPSHVLVAMFGKDSEKVTNSIRFSFGYTNTTEEIYKVAEETAKIVKRLINF